MGVMWGGSAGRSRHNQECWLVAGWGPGALTMLIKTCDKFMSSAQTTDCPGAHPGPRRLLCSSPSAPALTIPARFGTAPQRIQHLLTWAWLEVQPLETAKMPEKYKKCLTKHLRVGVLRYGEHIPRCSHMIHPNTQTQALPRASAPAEGLAYGKVLD